MMKDIKWYNVELCEDKRPVLDYNTIENGEGGL